MISDSFLGSVCGWLRALAETDTPPKRSKSNTICEVGIAMMPKIAGLLPARLFCGRGI